MAIMPLNSVTVEQKMVYALKVARSAWEKAEMPTIYTSYSNETGKIALAILAAKLMDELQY